MQQPYDDPDDPLRPPQRSPNTGVVGPVLPAAPPPPSPEMRGPGTQTSGWSAPQAIAPPAPFQREQFRDSWMSTGSDAGRQNQLLQQHNLTPDSSGRVTLPTGEVIDLRFGAKAGGTQATWTGAGGQKAGQAPGGPTGTGVAGGAGAAGAAGSAGSDFQNQIRQMLLAQMQGLSKPISADDPTIQGEMQAQERTLERGRQDRRAAMAERSAMQGLLAGGQSSGAFDADLASGYEDKGAAKTGLQAQLFGRELQARRSQMANMMNMALQSGDSESARALQMQMAQMDSEIQKMGLNQRQSQFDDEYGLRSADAQYARDRDGARARAGLPF